MFGKCQATLQGSIELSLRYFLEILLLLLFSETGPLDCLKIPENSGGISPFDTDNKLGYFR